MAYPMHAPYFEDNDQLLASLNERYGAWVPSPCTPQFAFPDQLTFPSFRMPSPPVSPSLPRTSFSTESSGFVSLASVAPPRNDTVFGWNSLAVAASEPALPHPETGHNSADETPSRSRPTLKRPASPSPTPSLSSSSSTSPTPMQQPESTPTPTPAPKRARAQISSKDFVPPDVSGLSKREARLVKNRAAAFLSRQRKREEFEELEKHCQELERENARLQAGTQSPSKKLKASEPEPALDISSELARLRESNAQLAAQNAQLAAQNAHLTAENARLALLDVQPKLEDDEDGMLLSEPTVRREKETKEKHTGSVALMVLMISLSLLGKPLASGVNNARGRAAMSLHAPSAPQPSSTFDFVLPRTSSDYEWLTSPTDLDHDDFAVPTVSLAAPSSTRTLTVQGLENLAIPTDIRDFNFAMDVDERDARNVVLAVSNTGSCAASSSAMSTLSSPSCTSIDSAWPEPSVDSTMAMLGGDYMSYDYDSDIFATPSVPVAAPSGTRRMTVAVVPSSGDGEGRWSVEVKESL